MERIARESVEDLPEQVETIPGDLVQRQVRCSKELLGDSWQEQPVSAQTSLSS